MSDLKNTTIGGKSVTLKRVPARDARHIQTMLASILADPLVEVLGQQSSEFTKGKTKGQQVLGAMNAVSSILPKLDNGDLDRIIDKCKPFIFIDGKPFNEDLHFTADTLFDMYEVIWYFLKETFEGFITAARSRFMPAEAATTVSEK